MKRVNYEAWFDATFRATYLTLERAGRVLLTYLCPAIMGDLHDLMIQAYMACDKKKKKLYHHPNVTGWLIVAFRYETYHRIRSWDRESRLRDELNYQERIRATSDSIKDVLEDKDLELVFRSAIGNKRYELLKAYYLRGLTIDELALMCGTSDHGMEVALSRWRRKCEKALNCPGLLSIIPLWFYMNFSFFWNH